MNKGTPLTGYIYGYKHIKTKQMLYIGQTIDIVVRDKAHFTEKKNTANKKLQEIGRQNIELDILHKKLFDNHIYSKENRIEYQNWANEYEIKEIDHFNTYKNGLNYTKGGQHTMKQQPFIEYAYKKSREFFDKFIEGAKIYKKTGNDLGFCPRNEIICELDNYKLGEALHKFRHSNSYKTIWADKNCVKLLNEVGYTQTSIEAGVNRAKRGGETSSNNNWDRIKPLLEWLYKNFDHINYTNKENPKNLPNSLISKTNYSTVKTIIMNLRAGKFILDGEKKTYLKKFNFFETDDDFMNHKMELGLKWYYNNEIYSYPQKSYILSNNDNKLPKYMTNFNLGANFGTRRKDRKKFTSQCIKLIEKNKNKPRPNMKSIYHENPTKKKDMIKKVKDTAKNKDNNDWKMRNWTKLLKTKFSANFDKDLKQNNRNDGNNYSDYYLFTYETFTHKSSRHMLFTVSRYESKEKCFEDYKKYKLSFFYLRKWYIKTFIKKLQHIKIDTTKINNIDIKNIHIKNVKDLNKICKECKIPNYSKNKKAELINKITEAYNNTK